MTGTAADALPTVVVATMAVVVATTTAVEAEVEVEVFWLAPCWALSRALR
jgi:hypothetical protein